MIKSARADVYAYELKYFIEPARLPKRQCRSMQEFIREQKLSKVSISSINTTYFERFI
jgi:hypothetical protein